MTATTAVPARDPGRELPVPPRISFDRIVRVELRKSLDTRAGAVLLAVAFLLTVAPVGWQLTHLDAGVPDFALWVSTARGGVVLVLPILGILAMTSEWTQRTALTTFTLVPRRGRVLAAKIVVALGLGLVVMAFAAGVASLALLVAASVHDVTPVWGDAWGVVGGSLVASSLNVVMGAAFGALIAQTAVAIAVFFVAPVLWQVAGRAALRDDAEWLDVFQAFGRLSDFDVAGHWPQVATSALVWVVVPLVLGTMRAFRRDVS